MNVESKVPYGLVFETKQEREGASVDPNYWQANDAANAAIQVLTFRGLLAIQVLTLRALLCKQNEAGFQVLTLLALPGTTPQNTDAARRMIHRAA